MGDWTSFFRSYWPAAHPLQSANRETGCCTGSCGCTNGSHDGYCSAIAASAGAAIGRNCDGNCKVGCPIIAEERCDACMPRCDEPRGSCLGLFGYAARKTVVDTTASRYVFACATYLVYATCIILIDIYSFGGYQYQYGMPVLGGEYLWSSEFANNFYMGLGVVHFVNAWQFWYSWYGRKWNDVCMWPEYMNVLGSCLYLISASYYPQATITLNSLVPDPNSPDPANPIMITPFTDFTVMRVHYIETAAAVWETIAAVGWCYIWWAEYPRKPGRGFTLDDPDLHANICIFVPALIYLAYNITLLLDPTTYGSGQLYIVGDAGYFAGAIFYFLGAARDSGWLWWMPLAGRCNPMCPSCPDPYGPTPGEVGAGPAEQAYWGPTWGAVEDDSEELTPGAAMGDHAKLLRHANPYAVAVANGAAAVGMVGAPKGGGPPSPESPTTLRISNRAMQRGGTSQRLSVMYAVPSPGTPTE